MEAAFLLPSFLVVLLLALQPACVLYTRAVMESAAGETARLMCTAEGQDEDALEAFALRRLGAVPDISIFHVGGALSWDIGLGRASADSRAVQVEIAGRVRPLPVLGAFVRAFGATDASGNVEVKVSVSYEGRPSWLEGSYDSWIAN